MRKLFLFVICCLLIVLPVAAQDTAELTELVVTDGLDRELTLTLPVESVITLLPNLTEIVAALGCEDLLVGVDSNSDYPETLEDLPIVDNYDMSLNMEEILALDPDLVLASEMNTPEQVAELESLGIPVYWLSYPTDFDTLYESIREVAAILDVTDEADELIEDLTLRVDAVREELADIETRPVVFYEIDGSDPAKPWTTGSGTFVDYLITEAGGVNIAANIEGEWAQISEEFLLTKNPEVILLADAEWGTTPEIVAARPGWDSMNAIKNERVYAFDADLSSRPGPRLVDGLEVLARLIHPECY